MASQSSLLVLNRLLALKDSSLFSLVVDSLAQTSHFLLNEFVYQSGCPVIYLSFETTTRPSYATYFMDCLASSPEDIARFVEETTPSLASSSKKHLIIIDSLNYLPAESLTTFISQIALPSATVIGCFHSNVPQPALSGYPGAYTVLLYIAQSIFHVSQVADVEDDDDRFEFSIGCNSPTFKLHLVNRRKSGKSLTYDYIVNTTTHQYEIDEGEENVSDQEDEAVLKDLTTFNLTTSSKQKVARDQVELPFMEAQTEMGKFGGAIVYEFEKDDDYDEEDPYEDPF